MAKQLTVLSLFAGIGGFDLGLERTGGFHTGAFCEIDPFAQRILAKHWPGVPIYDDVTQLTGERLAADGISVDVICGGFPCQDISRAGRGAGIDGERSGLWREFARLIGELRPEYVIMENSPALLDRGLGAILGALASLGYDAEWHCIPASYIGAPHVRDRAWIVAYPGRGWRRLECARLISEAKRVAERNIHFWRSEPVPRRVANGVPNKSHRHRVIGNAVVPQIPELIGKAILAAQGRAA